MISLFSFLFGTVIGSFLNVCIYRLPRGESVVRPRSRCLHCGQRIAAYDNIPLFSYLVLRGRCRQCRARISAQYFFVELATGLVFLTLFDRFGLSLDFAKHAAFSSVLIVLAITDWRERILPDRINFTGIALGLFFSLLLPVGDGAGAFVAAAAGMDGLPRPLLSLSDALLGALVGGGLLYLLGEIYFRLRQREGMGLGDVKMMAMVGCFLGPRLVLLTILLASLGGSALGSLFLLIFRKGRHYELPFGSFLAVGAFVAAIWGWPILRWYAGFFR